MNDQRNSGVKFEDTVRAVGVCLSANIPVLLWGPPGNGKTTATQGLSDSLSMHLETVIASIREPADFGGLPVVGYENSHVRRVVEGVEQTIERQTPVVDLAPPSWAYRIVRKMEDEQKISIAFYDEISTAAPATQAALLRPILEGVVGDLVLPPETRTIAAANPPEYAADGWDLSAPNANRFIHLDWVLPADVIRDGFAGEWPKVTMPVVDPESVEALLIETKIIMGAFIGVRSELATVMPSSDAERGKAWPSPRTWEFAAKAYAHAKAAGMNENVVQLVVSGAVGSAAAGEFLTFIEHIDLPDPDALLENPDLLVVPSDRGDKVYAITASVFAALRRDVTVERWTNAGELFGKVAAAGHADVAFIYARPWVANDFRPRGAMPSEGAMRDLIPVLQEMGLYS